MFRSIKSTYVVLAGIVASAGFAFGAAAAAVVWWRKRKRKREQ